MCPNRKNEHLLNKQYMKTIKKKFYLSSFKGKAMSALLSIQN